MAQKAPRRMYVDTYNRLIRNAVPGRAHRKIQVEKLKSIHKSYEQRTKAIINFTHQDSDWVLIFNTVEEREKFVGLCMEMMDQKIVVEEVKGDEIVPDASPSSALSQSKLQMLVGTWNVGDTVPSDCLNLKANIPSWLIPGMQIYVIGLQECKNPDLWIQFMLELIDNISDSRYQLVTSQALWGIVIIIFVRIDLVSRVTSVRQAQKATGVGDILGNKGGVAVLFRYDDSTFCFVGSHLAARREHVKERRQDFLKIVESIQIGNVERDILNQFHHVVWFGDLNFRVEKDFDETCRLVEARDFPSLLLCEQLIQEMETGNIFIGFREPPINFKPTYRMLRDEVGYSNKKNQSPSWTDRILTLSMKGCEEELIPFQYDGAHDVLGSDHRPVYCIYDFIPRKQPIHSVTFDVYLDVSLVSFTRDTPFNGNEHYVIQFSGSVLEDKPTSLQGKLADSKKTMIWDGFELPVIKPFLRDPLYLQSGHLEITIGKLKGKSDQIEPIGFSVFPLAGSFENVVVSRENRVTYYGQMVGMVSWDLKAKCEDEEYHEYVGTMRGGVPRGTQVGKDYRRSSMAKLQQDSDSEEHKTGRNPDIKED
eukprot:TRINITY_DN8433_c0_g1_i1.p1 TRINITY_DN8433_c0_g1~~TRINITY_DN8433_c0_g1_i1.p1  ORF type:complete len:616 (+),score=135.44 TRINITY_DN8433_c0_g1_i1:71-1849(+)